MNTSQLTNAAGPMRELDERLVELRREAEELINSLGAARGDLESALRQELERRPYAVLGIGAALGYVAGGGLPSRLTALLLTLGARVGMEYLSRQFSLRLSQSGVHTNPKQNEVTR